MICDFASLAEQLTDSEFVYLMPQPVTYLVDLVVLDVVPVCRERLLKKLLQSSQRSFTWRRIWVWGKAVDNEVGNLTFQPISNLAGIVVPSALSDTLRYCATPAYGLGLTAYEAPSCEWFE